MGGHGRAHVMLWVGMGGHRSMLLVMVWVWVQILRKMLGSDVKSTWIPTRHRLGRISRSFGLFFQKPSLGGRLSPKPGDHSTLTIHSR